MTTYAGEVRIKTRLDAAGINTGLTKVSGMLGKLALAVGVGFSINAIVNFSKASVEAASKSESAWTGLGFVLNANNRSLTEAKGFLEDYVSDGLVPLTDAIKAYQNMVMRGYDTAQIEDMLRIMKDSAAFGRQGQYSMGEAIEKATQGLRMENSLLTDSVGIQTNVARMWDEYARSIGTTTNALTLAQKRQAEYNGFMKEGGVFAGAAAKYANTYAGRISQLSTAFYNLRVAVGNAVIPILNQIIPILTNVINWFTRLFNIVGQVMNLLYGTNVSMADTASGAQDAANATGEMADNLEDANKAAKGSLAAFDKLNVLNPPAEGGGGPGEGGGGGGSIIPPIEPPNTDTPWLDKIRDHLVLIQGLVEAVGIGLLAWGISRLFGLDLTKTLGVMMIAAGVVMFVRGAFDALENGVDWDNLILMIGGVALVAGGLAIVFGATAAAIGLLIGGIAMLVIGIMDWVKQGELSTQTFWLLEAAIVAIGVALAMLLGWPALVVAAVIAIALAIYKYWDEIKAFLVGLWESIKEIFGVVAGWFDENVIQPVVAFFKGLWESVKGFFIGLWDDIVAIWDKVATWFDEHVIQPIVDFFSPILNTIYIIFYDLWLLIKYVWDKVATWFKENVIDPIVTFFKKLWEDVSGFFSDLWEDVKEIWAVVSTWFQENVTGPVIAWFKGVWENVSTYFSDLWTDIKTVWEVVSNWFQVNVIDPVVTAWDTATTKIGEFFTNMWDGVKDGAKIAINWVIEKINGFLSGIVGGINSLFEKWNSIPIPGWLSIPLIAVPQIPLLATGAVIPANAPFAAILGDQKHGTNIEAPESLLRDLIREELGRNQSRQDTIHNVIKLDGQVLYEAVKKIDKRVGTSLISGSGIR